MNMGCQIKSPVDMLVGMMREFEVKFPTPDQYATNYGLWNLHVSYFTNLQQNIGDPPDVSGWKAYYQDPDFMNTGSIPTPYPNVFNTSIISQLLAIH